MHWLVWTPYVCKPRKKDLIYFHRSIWAKFHHTDSEIGPMSFVIKLNMSCKSFKLHLSRESHIIGLFILSLDQIYIVLQEAKWQLCFGCIINLNKI